MAQISSLSAVPETAVSETDAARLAALQNVEAEQALLGAILINNHAFERVGDAITAAHFTVPVHGRIFAACADLIEQGKLANPITLKALFDRDEALKEEGGARYLMQLADTSVTLVNPRDYAALIRDLHTRRELVRVGEAMVQDAYDASFATPAEEQVEGAEQRLFDLATQGRSEGALAPFTHALVESIKATEAAHKRDGGLAGVTTGLRDVDAKLGGLHKSDLLILAGRPGMGKTALATAMAYNAAAARRDEGDDHGAVVAFFSLEMSSEQLATRILATETQLDAHRMRTGRLQAAEFERLVGASRMMETMPLFIDDTAGMTVSAIRTRARRLHRTHGLGLIVIDYIQLLNPPPGRRSDNRVQELSEMTRGLKLLAKELSVPVLALSQLSRAVEQRDDKRPLLSDLRESGSIEQDADVVMFVYREAYYLERKAPDQEAEPDKYVAWQERMDRLRNKSELIVAKQRHGPTGAVDLFFNGAFTQFGDWADPDHYPEPR